MKRVFLAAGILMGCLPVSAEEAAPAACPHSALKTATALLSLNGTVRVRVTTAAGRFEGVFSGIGCEGLEFTSRDERFRKAAYFEMADFKRLEVGRRGIAGWKGALLGVAVGSALGAVLRNSDQSATHGAIVGAIAFGLAGATWPTTKWQPVPLDAQSQGR